MCGECMKRRSTTDKILNDGTPVTVSDIINKIESYAAQFVGIISVLPSKEVAIVQKTLLDWVDGLETDFSKGDELTTMFCARVRENLDDLVRIKKLCKEQRQLMEDECRQLHGGPQIEFSIKRQGLHV